MTVINQNQIIQNLLPQNNTARLTSQPEGAKELGKEAFLKLLVTQLKHQDPLNPLEGIEFTAQLAQFTSLEQLFNLNKGVETMTAGIKSQSAFQAVDLVGKGVKAQSQVLGVKNGQCTQGVLSLDEAAASVLVNIYDQNGFKIRTLDLGALSPGHHKIEWDGRDAVGSLVADGNYYFQVLAVNAYGEALEATSRIEGRITGVTFDQSGQPILVMNGLEINIRDILEIIEPQIEGQDK